MQEHQKCQSRLALSTCHYFVDLLAQYSLGENYFTIWEPNRLALPVGSYTYKAVLTLSSKIVHSNTSDNKQEL